MRLTPTRPSPPSFAAAVLLASVAALGVAFADVITPDRPPEKDNSVAAEMASFDIHEDFEVSLFADETLGIANPIAIHWDHRGRLWVLTTLAYAQLEPGKIPNDKLFILEDTDGDGRADKSTVFAEGLDMPTGFALGDGGAYLAEGPDLVHLRDSDGDDVADRRQVVLTGFGTGDTHQNISNLAFDSGGFLYFSQGLHAFSHVETPWGVSRGDHAGFWRFDPRTERLDPFCFPSMASQNPCGIAFDRWGALFVKSNGPELCFATPGLIPTTHPKELMHLARVGATPGKSMGAEIVETAHQPDWLQQHALIAGYFARKVTALPLVEEGAGFQVSEPVELLGAGHASFRPVDIRVGPDGAIYIADWFNPVINHYQVSLRHPHRDYDHGRIWKLSAKGRPPVEPAGLVDRPVEGLFEALRSEERWTRDQARRVLADADADSVADPLVRWAETLDPKSPADSHALVEAVGVLESHRLVPPTLLDRLQESTEPRARAVVARLIARSADPIPDADERLAALLRDPHPRPRLEAVIACANRPQADSLPLALTALDSEVDKNIDYSLHQAVHALAEQWLPAVQADRLEFVRPAHLAFALEAYGGEIGAAMARRTLDADGKALPAGARAAFLRILARSGNAEDLRRVLDQDHAEAALLDTLVASWPNRRLIPAPPFVPKLAELLQAEQTAVRRAAIQLSGLWRAGDLADVVENLALDPAEPTAIRSAALASLGSLRGKAAADQLAGVALAADTPATLRHAALEALATADIDVAAATVVELVRSDSPSAPVSTGDDLAPILTPVLGKPPGPAALTRALTGTELPPEVARKIAGALAGLGRTDRELTQRINEALGVVEADSDADYDAERVEQLVAAVGSGQGDAANGREVYQLAQLNCVACHQIDEVGGVIGPPLDAVGAGLPLDQIVESLLWPARQLKEGYFATAITTIDGEVHTGYVDTDAVTGGVVWLRDAATDELRPVSMHQLEKREEIGTLMPPGLTASLTEQELVDLIAFLASLKG
ncbi:MAG: PVC-type heme-binding CxxCH protein [Verrucomicrobiales bacterium]